MIETCCRRYNNNTSPAPPLIYLFLTFAPLKPQNDEFPINTNKTILLINQHYLQSPFSQENPNLFSPKLGFHTMYRDKGGGGSKAKMEQSLTATSSRGGGVGLNLKGKDSNKDRSFPVDSNMKLSKGEENIIELSETDSEESDVSGSDEGDASWISWFLNLRGNEFFCEVDENYIQDDFNLCGLTSHVPFYDYALDLILDVESSHGDMFSEKQNEILDSAAEMLYGLIHARYILTTKGMSAMLEKYKNAEFGRCPRVYCCGHPCLPIGQSDIPRQNNVKIFCPKCEDIYTPQSRFQDNLDGAYFGSTFPHLFLMTYGNLKPQKPSQEYIPKIFGFKVHKP